MKTKYTILLLLLATTFAVAAKPIAKLESFQFNPDQQKVLTPIEKSIWQTKPADRANWEAKLLATLESPKATVDGKIIILRRLLPSVISEKSVAVVAPLLLDAKLTDDARGVLQNYDAPSAAEALLAALPKAKGKTKLGLVQSLGLCRSPAAVAAVKAALYSDSCDASLMRACLTALGNIGDKAAGEHLLGIQGFKAFQTTLNDATLIASAHLAAEGQSGLATKLAKKVYAGEAATTGQKNSALRCLLKADPVASVGQVIQVAKDNKYAKALLGMMPAGKACTIAFGETLIKQNALAEPGMLQLLLDREDPAAMPVVCEALKGKLASSDRDAAMEFVGQFGALSDLGWLLKEFKAGNKTAAEALMALNADGVEDELLAKAETDASLIAILAGRRAQAALPMMIAQLKKPTNSSAVKAAASAVPVMAGEKDLPALIDALLANPKSTVTKVVVAVAVKGKGSAQTAGLVAAMPKASAKAQGELLSALAQIGGGDALKAVKAQMASKDEAVADAATRALCGWKSVEAMGELKTLAASTKNATYKVLAVRGYLTLADTQLDSRRGGTKSNVATIGKILPQCSRPEEKRMAISILKKCYCSESIAMLKTLAKDEAVAKEAADAIKAADKKNKPKKSKNKKKSSKKSSAGNDAAFSTAPSTTSSAPVKKTKKTKKAKEPKKIEELNQAAPVTEKWVSLFDGKTLTGWERHGGKADYKVEDGAIVGTSRPKTPNTFLCTTREYGDFALEYEYFPHDHLNCGVQFRSKIREKDDRVYGYQCEIDPSSRAWSAGVFGEASRGWLNPVECPKAQAAYKPGEWNKVRIVCIGHSIRTYLNGVPVADLFDKDEKEGIIGLQVHSVGKNNTPMSIKWRNLRIMELAPTNTVALLDAPADSMGKVAPRGATVLIAPGKGLDAWTVSSYKPKWMTNQQKGKLQWTVDTKTGIATVKPKTGSMVSKKKFGAQRIHVEFCTPESTETSPEKSGNSGIFIQDRYELQICNTAGLKPEAQYCGGIYRQRKPDVNAAKKPGEWQVYDIYFIPAKFKGKKKVANARVSAKLNGQWIHRDAAITGNTGPGPKEDASNQSLVLQDHGQEVKFRNVWVCDLDHPETLGQYDPRKKGADRNSRMK
ncbi:MAG: DUF1080 domain-containing protein, partial [Phycisphaerales bacterium]|jgi:hypothetical protein|nr:DUF1080 domain-containing protein [Phycisphaerales bacterium]MBT7171255.1 DUF1080 domain-containing protein [Phycisphaerales bacterium]